MQMAFRSARWRWEFLGTTWSNKSDANPPEGDTKPPGGNNPWSLLFRSSIQLRKENLPHSLIRSFLRPVCQMRKSALNCGGTPHSAMCAAAVTVSLSVALCIRHSTYTCRILKLPLHSSRTMFIYFNILAAMLHTMYISTLKTGETHSWARLL